jgi:ankyrin repeat protein
LPSTNTTYCYFYHNYFYFHSYDYDCYQDKAGNTSLHVAAAAGQEKALLLLLDSGGDATLLNAGGFDVLHLAAQDRRGEVMVDAILKRTEEAHPMLVNAKATNGWTALYTAAHHGNENVVKALVDLGADATVPGNDQKWLPLHVAGGSSSLIIIFLFVLLLSLSLCPRPLLFSVFAFLQLSVRLENAHGCHLLLP